MPATQVSQFSFFFFRLKFKITVKKFFSVLALLSLFLLASPKANAQLTFYNATPCSVIVTGTFNYTRNPCTGFICSTREVIVAPFSINTIAASAFTCFHPVPPVIGKFASITVRTSLTQATTVSICNNPISQVRDCQSNLKTVRMFNSSHATIY